MGTVLQHSLRRMGLEEGTAEQQYPMFDARAPAVACSMSLGGSA
jgi:hypothetical protein